jgi:hypothetical protein
MSAAQTLGKNSSVQGGAAALGGLVQGAATIGGAALVNKGLQGVVGKLAPGAAEAASGAIKSVVPKLGGALAVGMGAVQVANGVATGNKGEIGSGIGSTAGALIGGAIGTAIAPGIGTFLGGMAGSFIGGWAGNAIATSMGGDSSTVGLGTSNPTGGKPDFALPVKGPITCKYGVKDNMHPNGHHGVDFGVAEGTPVQSVGAGRVIDTSISKALGNTIKVDHGNGYVSRYCHLQTTLARVGDNVVKGQVIAKSGNTGTATTGAHLHLEMYKNGSYMDPMLVLGGAVSAVTGSAESGAGATGATSAVGSAAALGYSPDYSAPQKASVPASYSGAGIAGGAASVSTSTSGASNGRGDVSQAGVSATAPKGTGGGTGPVGNSGGNNVTINLSIKDASESEARKFAQMVKNFLETDQLTTSMGAL